MAASTAGALKAFIEAGGLGLTVYRDATPAGYKLPYALVVEAIALVPDPSEDGALATVTETAQLDLWQKWKDGNDKLVEDVTLAPKLAALLHGARLAALGVRQAVTYGVLVHAAPRMLERDANLVHHPFTLTIHRQN